MSVTVTPEHRQAIRDHRAERDRADTLEAAVAWSIDLITQACAEGRLDDRVRVELQHALDLSRQITEGNAA